MNKDVKVASIGPRVMDRRIICAGGFNFTVPWDFQVDRGDDLVLTIAVAKPSGPEIVTLVKNTVTGEEVKPL
jgi:hypothetical protein